MPGRCDPILLAYPVDDRTVFLCHCQISGWGVLFSVPRYRLIHALRPFLSVEAQNGVLHL